MWNRRRCRVRPAEELPDSHPERSGKIAPRNRKWGRVRCKPAMTTTATESKPAAQETRKRIHPAMGNGDG
jgi:hypothetical protein